MGDDEKLNELVMQLGRKIIDIQSDVKIPFRQEIRPLEISISVHAKERQSSILRLVRICDEYKELLHALNESLKIERNRLDEILTEFTMVSAYGPCGSRSWDSKFVEKELSLMTKAFIQGLTTPSLDRGIVFPLLNIEMYVYSIDLGEFGVIRRSTFSETTEFAIHYPNFTMPHNSQRFKYVLDVGEPDSTDMYPVPVKYMKILERTIFALRLVFGDGVGVEYAHWWIKEEDTFVSTIPMSKYLAPRGDPTKIYASDVDQLVPIIRSIHELDEDSCYILSLRRHGTAHYTLDFGFGDAVVHSVIGLESIFGYPKSNAILRILEITRNKHKEITWLFDSGRYGEVRGVEFKELLERCWRARNKIAHGDKSGVAEKKAGMHLYWVSRISLLFLRFGLLNAAILGFPNRKNLIRELDSQIEFPKKGIIERITSFICRKLRC
ncbi:MAG: hypothetical protein E3J86_10140 [Candidatus Thorarchaeota archaeon]|nr:MAG: hypothetical protein E3J86_10140 [Candidatus Thorarchaeota archaeon]